MAEVSVQVVPLTPERRDEFLAFMDGPAFADNPRWAKCYCQEPLEDHRQIDWAARTAEENRALLCTRVDTLLMRGYLAYRDGVVVGWCSAGPRTGYRALDDDPVDDAESVGSIMCFLIAPDLRGQGIARALLAAAVDGFRARGLAVAEAFPRTADDRNSANYHGPLRMYLDAGFEVMSEDQDSAVVRLALD